MNYEKQWLEQVYKGIAEQVGTGADLADIRARALIIKPQNRAIYMPSYAEALYSVPLPDLGLPSSEELIEAISKMYINDGKHSGFEGTLVSRRQVCSYNNIEFPKLTMPKTERAANEYLGAIGYRVVIYLNGNNARAAVHCKTFKKDVYAIVEKVNSDMSATKFRDNLCAKLVAEFVKANK